MLATDLHHLQEQRRDIEPMLAAQGLQRITRKHDLSLVHCAYAGPLTRSFPKLVEGMFSEVWLLAFTCAGIVAFVHGHIRLVENGAFARCARTPFLATLIVAVVAVVNVNKRERSSMFWPTMSIPLDHVLDAQADPDIERKLWRAWVLGTSSEVSTAFPSQGSGSTTPDTLVRTRP